MPIILSTICTAMLAADVPPPAATAQDIRPLAVGAEAPMQVALTTGTGQATTLAEATGGKPAVVVFYRGRWCPFCTMHLSRLPAILPDLQASGWRLVAISPDQPADVQQTADQYHLSICSDAGHLASRSFGIAFQAGPDRVLPVPAVFLIGADGTIRFAHANPDYRQRLDPAEILRAADRP
jgi:peroxiredoxin